MALFQFRWLRRFLRKNTNPIPVASAALWKQRLSIVYMLVAWNAFGCVCYMIYTGKSDWAKYHGLKSEAEANISPGQQWAHTLGIDNAKVYRFSGVTKQHEYSIEDGQVVQEQKNASSLS